MLELKGLIIAAWPGNFSAGCKKKNSDSSEIYGNLTSKKTTQRSQLFHDNQPPFRRCFFLLNLNLPHPHPPLTPSRSKNMSPPEPPARRGAQEILWSYLVRRIASHFTVDDGTGAWRGVVFWWEGGSSVDDSRYVWRRYHPDDAAGRLRT